MIHNKQGYNIIKDGSKSYGLETKCDVLCFVWLISYISMLIQSYRFSRLTNKQANTGKDGQSYIKHTERQTGIHMNRHTDIQR